MQQKKESKIRLRCILPESGRSLGSLSFKPLILVKKQEPEQASKCPGVGKCSKNRNKVYLNEATIVTSRRKNIEVAYSCTRLIFGPSPSTFRFEYECFLRLKVSSTSTQKSCRPTQVRAQYSSTPSLLLGRVRVSIDRPTRPSITALSC